jgi:SAM-dependent methyltransferase
MISQSPLSHWTGSWHDRADLEAPNAARIYDFLLGGSHNFDADRQVARAAMAAVPDLAQQAAANRAFLRRAVRYLVGVGVRQFLDLGCGIPTAGNVHEIAQDAAPDARIVYVDNDPVAVAHSAAVLAGNPAAVAIEADLRAPQAILDHPAVQTVLDLTQPVGVLLVAVLHFIPDADDPAGIIRHLTQAMRPGSHLVIAHGVNDARPADAATLTGLWTNTTSPLTLRSAVQIHTLFRDLKMVSPGVVWAPQWRPDGPPPRRPRLSANLVGIGRVP